MEDILDNENYEQGPYDYQGRVDYLKEVGYDVPIFRYISQAFDIFLQWPLGFVGFFILSFIINAFIGAVPFIGWVGSLLVSAPLGMGYAIVTQKIRNGEMYEFSDFFQGFEKAVPLFLASLVMVVVAMIGFVILVAPGIFLIIAFLWVNYFIFFGGFDFWPAMQLSGEVITRRWFDMFLFGIVLMGLNLGGALLLGLGLLVTLPVSSIALYLAFNDIIEQGYQEESW